MSALFEPRTGAVHALAENAMIILHCTVQPTVPQDVRSRLDSDYGRGDVVVMDAPVTGSTKEAEDGTLTMMVSAAKADYVERSDIRDVLACMAQKVYHISGPLGSALKVKVLNQALCGIHIVAAAEIVGLAAVTALDTKRFFQYVTGPGAELGRKQDCWVLGCRR
jgi:3-hydroxyisobutyrate dehydrogenase-like beta-hydroxyacid dehydrogenase